MKLSKRIALNRNSMKKTSVETCDEVVKDGTESFRLSDFEIMAPVGSYESLSAAIKASAGSVYFGLEGLNMRAHSAKHFTVEDLYRIVELCKPNQIKTYLTLNTVIYDADLGKMRELVDAAQQAGVSAVIASDVAVMQYAALQGMEVHLSTQLNISNVEAVRFYAQFADVVVLARELNLDQVAAIYRQILDQDIRGPRGEFIRIEMFAHGALCMAVSGKCYLSLHELNKSANRGACAQICRRAYSVRDREDGVELDIENAYIMSPKDLKTIHFVNKMMDAGVRLFKIEGRARGPEYVHQTVICYQEAISAVCQGVYDEQKIDQWEERLSMVFNRGFWDGYYLGKRLGEWTHQYGSSATHEKIAVGRVTNYFSQIGVAEIEIESCDLLQGEELIITGSTTGLVSFVADDIRWELKSVTRAGKGQRISIKVPERVRTGDRLYKMQLRKAKAEHKY